MKTTKRIGDICEILNGFAFKSNEYVENGIRVMRITNVQKGDVVDDDPKYFPQERENEISRYLLREGDLLMSLTGNVGRVGLLHAHLLPAALNQRVACLRIKKDGISMKYLFHILNSNTFESDCIYNASGIAQKNMSTRWLENYEIDVPPLYEQQRIVAKLDLLTGIIEKQKAQLKELDTLAQSIFYDMFGNPEENLNKWEEIKLESLCSVITKGTTPTTIGFKFIEDGVNFLKVESFTKEEHIDIEKVVHISEACHKAMQRSSLEEDDILMCIAGATVGRLGKVPKFILPANTNQAFGIIRLKDKDLVPYIYSYLHSPYIQNIVSESKKGVAQPNLTLSQLRNYKIVLPPKEIQSIYTLKIQTIESQKEFINRSIAESQKLFDYTMDKYFG